jgi:DNA-binding MarR family transcriptional regulator
VTHDSDSCTGDLPAEPGLAAWRAFLEVHARLTEVLERELQAQRDLPLSWYDVLVQLNDAGGRLRMHGLARAVLLSRAGLTRLVDRMEAAGLVRREPCEDDRRGTYVILTEAGQARLEDAAPVHLRGIEQHFASHLDRSEARTLQATFERMLAALD